MRNRYLFQRHIGEGAFGRVWEAIDQATNRRVAVKELIRLDRDARERFERETLHLVRQMNNRHVVDILDCDMMADQPFIVMEYCADGSIRRWIDERLPWRSVGMVLAHVVQGLWGIHRLKAVHRDIKPQNLLIANDGAAGFLIKIADFGLARNEGSSSTDVCGTIGYIAPEVLRGETPTPACDVYAVGVVATELITGAQSVDGLNRAAIPAGFANLIREMRAPEPTSRPSAPVVAEQLDKLLQGPPASPPSRQAGSPSTPTGEGSSGGGFLAATLIGAVASLGLLALFSRSGASDAEWDASVARYRGPDGRFRKS